MPSYTFTDLKAELADRGFSSLSDTRLGRYVNDGYLELAEAELWPFRLATASGTAPLTVSDLGVVESVTETSTPMRLGFLSRQTLSDTYVDLTRTGQPQYVYVDNGAVRTYPVGGTLSVRYYKVPAELSSGSDAPIVPARYQSAIVDFASRRAFEDANNTEQAEATQRECDRWLDRMRKNLLGGQQVQDRPVALDMSASGDW